MEAQAVLIRKYKADMESCTGATLHKQLQDKFTEAAATIDALAKTLCKASLLNLCDDQCQETESAGACASRHRLLSLYSLASDC